MKHDIAIAASLFGFMLLNVLFVWDYKQTLKIVVDGVESFRPIVWMYERFDEKGVDAWFIGAILLNCVIFTWLIRFNGRPIVGAEYEGGFVYCVASLAFIGNQINCIRGNIKLGY